MKRELHVFAGNAKLPIAAALILFGGIGGSEYYLTIFPE
jgi:hypothetical protein